MRADAIKLGLLAAVLLLGTGASPDGVRQADRWSHKAQMAHATGQWDVAYDYYMKVAETFPGTPHGRLALRMARHMQDWAISPARSPADEDPVSLTCELFDLVTWP